MLERFSGPRRHKLLPLEIARKLPPLYANEEKPQSETLVLLKLFSPWSDWTWYITEMDQTSGTMFGLIAGHELELGYADFTELETLNKNGLPLIERDCYYKPETLETVYKRERKRYGYSDPEPVPTFEAVTIAPYYRGPLHDRALPAIKKRVFRFYSQG